MTKEKKFYSLANDPVFKNVFYRDDNLLKRFLTDILSIFYDNVDIKNFKVLNTELTKDRLYIRNKVVDILVDIGTKVINIEVNVKYDDYRIYRNFFYLASSTIGSMKKDMNFVDVKEHVQFNFNFKKNYKNGYKISKYGDLSTGEVTIPFMKTIDIDVDYYKDKWYNSGKPREYYEQYQNYFSNKGKRLYSKIFVYGQDEDISCLIEEWNQPSVSDEKKDSLKLKLIELEEQEKEMAKIKGESMNIDFGSQIRSYVMHPYSMVKDHRTNCETSNVSKVLDGDLDMFIEAYLRR